MVSMSTMGEMVQSNGGETRRYSITIGLILSQVGHLEKT